MIQHYYLNDHVSYRKLNHDFLVFSGKTRETLLVDQIAYHLVLFLKEGPRSFLEIAEHLKTMAHELDDMDLSEFIDMTLKQFLEHGVLGFR